MTRQGGMKQAARDWLNRIYATGNGIWNRKNESDVRTGLTSVRQLLYFPIYCFFTSPYWCTLSPNWPIEKKESCNDRTRPMKAYQGFYSLAKRAYYRSESDSPYWPGESAFPQLWLCCRKGHECQQWDQELIFVQNPLSTTTNVSFWKDFCYTITDLGKAQFSFREWIRQETYRPITWSPWLRHDGRKVVWGIDRFHNRTSR